MKRTDTVKITMFGDSNTNKGKLDLVGRIKNPSLPLGGYPLPPIRDGIFPETNGKKLTGRGVPP